MLIVARAAAALPACIAVLAFANDDPSGQFEILTLSNRADGPGGHRLPPAPHSHGVGDDHHD